MIFPAIDLMGGGCVRLYKGDFNQRTDYDITPIDVARLFAKEGAEWIHIVDLDGAKHGKTESGPRQYRRQCRQRPRLLPLVFPRDEVCFRPLPAIHS